MKSFCFFSKKNRFLSLHCGTQCHPARNLAAAAAFSGGTSGAKLMPIRNRLVAAGTGLVLLLIGAAVLGAGAWLIDLGGSPYYAVAGAGFMLTGVLLLLGNAVALIVFAALLLGTLLWALAEIGLDWWPLAARGDVMVPLALNAAPP